MRYLLLQSINACGCEIARAVIFHDDFQPFHSVKKSATLRDAKIDQHEPSDSKGEIMKCGKKTLTPGRHSGIAIYATHGGAPSPCTRRPTLFSKCVMVGSERIPGHRCSEPSAKFQNLAFIPVTVTTKKQPWRRR